MPPVPPAPPSEDEAAAEPVGGTDEEGTNDDLTDDDATEQEPAPSTGRRRSYKESLASDVPRVKTVKVIVEPAARAPPSQPAKAASAVPPAKVALPAKAAPPAKNKGLGDAVFATS